MFTLDPTYSHDPIFVSSTSAKPNDSGALVPVELLMYNDLMGGRQIMDYSPMSETQASENQGSGWPTEVVGNEPNGGLDVFGAVADDLWSTTPKGLGLVQPFTFSHVG